MDGLVVGISNECALLIKPSSITTSQPSLQDDGDQEHQDKSNNPCFGDGGRGSSVVGSGRVVVGQGRFPCH